MRSPQGFERAGVPSEFIDYLPQSALAEEYRKADVVLLTSRLEGVNEGWNQVALEAMASGVPLIATDIPGVRDCVGDGGVLVPVENPLAVADAVERLFLHAGAWSEARLAGLHRAAGFSWNEIAKYVRSVYLRALEPRSAPVVDQGRWIADGGLS